MRDKVLVVDDEPQVVAGVRGVLRKEPYDVLCAGSGAEALEILRAHDVAVVLSDHNMPGTSGVELFAEMRERFPCTVRILLTGEATLYVALEAINRGEVYRFLTKPVDPLTLRLTLRQALQHQRLLARSRELLGVARTQRELLRDLEQDHPGITRVERDTTGAILVSDLPDEVDDVVRAIDDEIEAFREFKRWLDEGGARNGE